jgi:hypothetical protein
MTPSTGPDSTPSAEAAVPVLDEPPTDVPTASAGATGEPGLRQVYVSSGTRLDLAFLDGRRTTRRFNDRAEAEAEAARLRAEHGLPLPRTLTNRKDQIPVSMQGPYVEGTRFRVVLVFADGGESQRRFVTREAASAEMARLAALGVAVRAHARRPRLPQEAGAETRRPGKIRGPYPNGRRWRLVLLTDGQERQRAFPTKEAADAFKEALAPHLARRALIEERARVLFPPGKRANPARRQKLARAEAFAGRDTAGTPAVEEALAAGGDLDLRTLSSEGLG